VGQGEREQMAVTLPGIITWLQRHQVPFDEIHVGKPWCGFDGFYVDDRAVRPSEFLTLSLTEIHALLAKERGG
jgi:capsule biosynthesis phosphatase